MRERFDKIILIINNDELNVIQNDKYLGSISLNRNSLGVIHDFLILFGFSTDDYNEVIQTITTGG